MYTNIYMPCNFVPTVCVCAELKSLIIFQVEIIKISFIPNEIIENKTKTWVPHSIFALRPTPRSPRVAKPSSTWLPRYAPLLMCCRCHQRCEAIKNLVHKMLNCITSICMWILACTANTYITSCTRIYAQHCSVKPSHKSSRHILSLI